jgi:urease accessory protein
MLIKEKIGTTDTIALNGREQDWLPLAWYETNKRILHKTTLAGRTVSTRFLNENPQLKTGDVLYEDKEVLISVSILPCEVIIIRPANQYEIAAVCYEIGNKHLPLFYQDNTLLIAYEAPLFQLLLQSGYAVETGMAQLMHPLKTSVSPHGSSSESLFSKILKRTTG